MSCAAIVAASAASLASFALGLRSMMLRRDIDTKPSAPWPVTFSIMLTCAVLGGVAFSIWRKGDANWREALAYGGMAIGALVLLGNVIRQKRSGPAAG